MNRFPARAAVAAAALAVVVHAQEHQAPKEAPAVTAPVKTVEAAPIKVASPQTPAVPGTGNAWFPGTELDIGTVFNNEEAVGRFPFKNPGKDTVEWKNLTGSCTCTKAVIRVGDRRYELSAHPAPNTLVRVTRKNGVDEQEQVKQITIGAGESGDVEVHMEMHGVTGAKQASLDLHTTDTETPQIKLRWHASGAQYFVMTPAEVNLNQMNWNEKREFTVQVTSPLAPDFNILRMDDVGKDFAVKWEKATKDGAATWTISGSYGPVTNEAGGGGLLKFYTDVRGEASFSVRVMAMVKGPIEVKPGSFVTLGLIRKGTPRTEKVVIEPNDGVDLDATALRFEKLTFPEKFVSVKKSKEGKSLVLELVVSGEAPAGLVRGDLVVELNHPALKEPKRILFNGFVR